MNNIQEKDFLTWEWESKKPHGGPPEAVSRTFGDFMTFGKFEGEWAYYDVFGNVYRKLNEAHPWYNWHGRAVECLMRTVRMIFDTINLKHSWEECLEFCVPETFLKRLMEVRPSIKSDRYTRYSRSKPDEVTKGNKYPEPLRRFTLFLESQNRSVRDFVRSGGRELRYSMDSTNSWPPLNACNDTMESFFDAAFDKDRVMSVFDYVGNVVDFDILFDQPTLHPKFLIWIRFLYGKILMREWKAHVREINGMEEEMVDVSDFVEETLTEWKNSSSWVSLKAAECPVRYNLQFFSPKFDGYDGVEYKPVIFSKYPLTERKYQLGAEPRIPRSSKADTIPLQRACEEEASMKSIGTHIKTQGMIEAGAFESQDVEKEKQELKQVKQNPSLKEEENDLIDGHLKKEQTDEIHLTKGVIKEEAEQEIDLTGIGIKKESESCIGKRRFDGSQELERAINDPKLSKKPRYRVVYEIIDSDEE